MLPGWGRIGRVNTTPNTSSREIRTKRNKNIHLKQQKLKGTGNRPDTI